MTKFNLTKTVSLIEQNTLIQIRRNWEAMELTGNFFEHMDKSLNVKKMKGFFQQKKVIIWRLWFKTEKHEQQSYLLQTVSHNVEFKTFLKYLKQFFEIKEKQT